MTAVIIYTTYPNVPTSYPKICRRMAKAQQTLEAEVVGRFPPIPVAQDGAPRRSHSHRRKSLRMIPVKK